MPKSFWVGNMVERERDLLLPSIALPQCMLRGICRLLPSSAQPASRFIATLPSRIDLRAKFTPWPTAPGAMSWSNVLEGYAKLADPKEELPEGVYLKSDDKTLTIHDGYEKARFHFLIMRMFCLV